MQTYQTQTKNLAKARFFKQMQLSVWATDWAGTCWQMQWPERLNRRLPKLHYLFITYIVTSKPKRISVAAGAVHIIIS